MKRTIDRTKAMPRQHPFRRAASEYLVEVEMAHPETTLQTYRDHVKALTKIVELENLGNPSKWGELEAQTMRREIMDRYAPKSVTSMISVLNGILLRAENPIIENLRRRRRYKLPSPRRGPVRWLTEEEMNTLLSSATGNLRMVLVLGLMLGLRRKEIALLRVSSIGQNEILVNNSKGDEDDTVDIVGQALDEVRYYLDVLRPRIIQDARSKGYDGMVPREVLIHYFRGRLKPYYRSSITQMIRNHARNLGIMGANSHTLRRTFGDQVSEGTDIRVVQRLMRHKSISTTEQYIDPNRKKRIKALEALYARKCTLDEVARE